MTFGEAKTRESEQAAFALHDASVRHRHERIGEHRCVLRETGSEDVLVHGHRRGALRVEPLPTLFVRR